MKKSIANRITTKNKGITTKKFYDNKGNWLKTTHTFIYQRTICEKIYKYLKSNLVHFRLS